MELEQLEQELKTQISVLEEEECRLKDWLESLHQVENIVVCRGLDSAVETADPNVSSQLRTFVDRVSFNEELDRLRSVCYRSVNPKGVFEVRLNELRQKTLSIQPVKHNWKERLGLEKTYQVA